jgi:hypothetical protein
VPVFGGAEDAGITLGSSSSPATARPGTGLGDGSVVCTAIPPGSTSRWVRFVVEFRTLWDTAAEAERPFVTALAARHSEEAVVGFAGLAADLLEGVFAARAGGG